MVETKFFLDSGNPQDTKEADLILREAGFGGLSGQTTNPSLIATYLRGQSEKYSLPDFTREYKRIVQQIAQVISSSISIQVIANEETSASDILSQAYDRITWIPNAVVKIPCMPEGLKAAEAFCQEGPINITTVFSQAQAAAVYAATKKATYPVFVSPFIGRLEDHGMYGMDLIANIVKMYRGGDGHVTTLMASVRTVDHILSAIQLKCPVLTVPLKVIKQWQTEGFRTPVEHYQYPVKSLQHIPYEELSFTADWTGFSLKHPITSAAIAKYWEDWTSLVV